jgi:nucleoside-diphosphate-sugar epimerase
MRIFVTGASGWIGSAVTAELLANGHHVLGLARSDSSAEKVAALGAEAHRGSLEDLDSLRAAVEKSDGVVHLGYDHDFSQMERAAELNAAALDLFGSTLGEGAPLVIVSGVAGFSLGRPATERDTADTTLHPRIAASQKALALSDRGVRSIEARFAPTVHAPGDHGFVPTLVNVARERGVSGYIEEGANKWSAVHRTDAARLVAKAVESAPPGTVVHAIGEEGISTRAIAEAIGAGLNVPVESVPADKAAEHFGWIGMFFGMNAEAANDLTRELLDWEPTNPTLLEDLAGPAYFEAPAS